MNLSIIAFGAMTGLTILFVAGIVLMEKASKRTDFPKSDIAKEPDENPFQISDDNPFEHQTDA